MNEVHHANENVRSESTDLGKVDPSMSIHDVLYEFNFGMDNSKTFTLTPPQDEELGPIRKERLVEAVLKRSEA